MDSPLGRAAKGDNRCRGGGNRIYWSMYRVPRINPAGTGDFLRRKVPSGMGPECTNERRHPYCPVKHSVYRLVYVFLLFLLFSIPCSCSFSCSSGPPSSRSPTLSPIRPNPHPSPIQAVLYRTRLRVLRDFRSDSEPNPTIDSRELVAWVVRR